MPDDDLPPETLEERWLLEAQTARNLEALAAEHAGDLDEAIALYERNVAEGFPGDLPYGRLVAIYERRGASTGGAGPASGDRGLRSQRRARTPQDRRATVACSRPVNAPAKRARGSLEDFGRAESVQDDRISTSAPKAATSTLVKSTSAMSRPSMTWP